MISCTTDVWVAQPQGQILPAGISTIYRMEACNYCVDGQRIKNALMCIRKLTFLDSHYRLASSPSNDC